MNLKSCRVQDSGINATAILGTVACNGTVHENINSRAGFTGQHAAAITGCIVAGEYAVGEREYAPSGTGCDATAIYGLVT